MDYQAIIETFFNKLGRFDFDQAKTYIDQKKEILQRLAPTFPNQAQFMTMLTTFSHLAEVEKNYHDQPYSNHPQPQHSFLPTASFLRKPKSLKDMYNDILVELQQMESTLATSSTGNGDIKSQTSSPSVTASTRSQNMLKSQQEHRPSMENATSENLSTISSSERDPSTLPQSPRTALKNSFFRVLSPISSITPNQATQVHITPSNLPTANSGDPCLLSSGSGYEPPPNSTTTTPVAPFGRNPREFTEELISHFCRQLLNFIQARLDLIDVYDKLSEASSKQFTLVDGVAFRLSMLFRKHHKCFHHPLLAPIKEGVTIECETLMTLIKATIDMQHWRFLPTLYSLQDVQSKLSYWAASTFNKEARRGRFKVSKTQTAPRLYEWLCRFKDYLISKFTLYFHATLSRNLPSSSFKSNCSKLTVDYYSRLSSFQRKVDAIFITLLYDVSNEKDFRGVGYYFPNRDFQQPQGKNTLQPMVIIPAEARPKLSNLQAEIFMIKTTNQTAMIKDGHYQFHDNIKKLTYSISQPDLNIFLVTVCEGQRPDREAAIRIFSQDFTSLLSFSNIFVN
uniref:UPF0536 protein C12orf66 n=1 Tax=Aceria tosichella TaxID=561515 RepID=A0A6G1S5T2_9ACAR